MHMAARAGASFDEVIRTGSSVVAADQLMDGVIDLVDEIRLEVLLDEGSRLVVLRRPWR
jgi:urease subunit gamma/beta